MANILNMPSAGVTSDDLTATLADVLAGTTAMTSDSDDEAGTGAMPNNGAWNGTNVAGGSVTIPVGYHNGSGKVTASNGITYKKGTQVANDSASKSGNTTITASKKCRVIVIMTRSTRNTSDAIKWTIKKNNVQQESFTAATGGSASQSRQYDLNQGDTLNVAVTSDTGYAGPQFFFVADGESAFS